MKPTYSPSAYDEKEKSGITLIIPFMSSCTKAA
jgi:hypothetical protein